MKFSVAPLSTSALASALPPKECNGIFISIALWFVMYIFWRRSILTKAGSFGPKENPSFQVVSVLFLCACPLVVRQPNPKIWLGRFLLCIGRFLALFRWYKPSAGGPGLGSLDQCLWTSPQASLGIVGTWCSFGPYAQSVHIRSMLLVAWALPSVFRRRQVFHLSGGFFGGMCSGRRCVVNGDTEPYSWWLISAYVTWSDLWLMQAFSRFSSSYDS